MLRPEAFESADMVERFRREAEIVGLITPALFGSTQVKQNPENFI